MAIEIKELHIKINIEDESKINESYKLNPLKVKEFKADIIKICTRNVLEIINEKQQR